MYFADNILLDNLLYRSVLGNFSVELFVSSDVALYKIVADSDKRWIFIGTSACYVSFCNCEGMGPSGFANSWTFYGNCFYSLFF